jgi:hypothetical protein
MLRPNYFLPESLSRTISGFGYFFQIIDGIFSLVYNINSIDNFVVCHATEGHNIIYFMYTELSAL